MARAILSAVFLALLPACGLPRTVAHLQERSPPPELGRPGWVRACAGTGGWVFGIVGGVLSVALMPVTWPVRQLAGDALGPQARDEFLFFPATGLAATGHFLLGAPPDLLDFLFRRAWVGTGEPENVFEHVPGPATDPVAGSADPGAALPAAVAPAPAGAPSPAHPR